jgi:hypothetical protein
MATDRNATVAAQGPQLDPETEAAEPTIGELLATQEKQVKKAFTGWLRFPVQDQREILMREMGRYLELFKQRFN